MSANSLKQAVTSATSSVITLGSAVSGFNAFTAADDGIEQTYWAFEGDDFQICTGVYTHTGATLAITKILQKSVSGAISDLPVTGLTLTGAAVVLIGGQGFNQSQAIQNGVIGSNVFSPHNLNYDFNGKGGGEFTASAGRIVLTTGLFLYPVVIKSAGANIATVSAGGNFRIGMYRCNNDGTPSKLIFDSGDISTAVTGKTFATLSSPIILPAGRYLTANAVDNTTAEAKGARTSTNAAIFATAQGDLATGNGEDQSYYNQAYGAFPSTLPAADGVVEWATFGSIYK